MRLSALATKGGLQPLYGQAGIRDALARTAAMKNLTGGAPGSVNSTVTQNQILGAQLTGYHGNQAQDAAAVRNAESARASQTQAGGGYAANPTGVTGAGSASTEGIGRA